MFLTSLFLYMFTYVCLNPGVRVGGEVTCYQCRGLAYSKGCGKPFDVSATTNCTHPTSCFTYILSDKGVDAIIIRGCGNEKPQISHSNNFNEEYNDCSGQNFCNKGSCSGHHCGKEIRSWKTMKEDETSSHYIKVKCVTNVHGSVKTTYRCHHHNGHEKESCRRIRRDQVQGSC